MLGPFDYAVLVTSSILHLSVVVCVAYRKNFFRYFSLSLYMLSVALVSAWGYAVMRRFGFGSTEYFYFYYYTDSLLTILLFFVVMHFYQQVFSEMHVSKYIRGAALLLLGATALFSYIVMRNNVDHLTSRFVVELGQNLYFVGVVLTYLLWGAILKLRETRTRLVQLVLALGVYFSGTAATYALRNLFPNLQESVLKFIPPLFETLLPLAWAYTFTYVPEEARLATVRLLPRPTR